MHGESLDWQVVVAWAGKRSLPEWATIGGTATETESTTTETNASTSSTIGGTTERSSRSAVGDLPVHTTIASTVGRAIIVGRVVLIRGVRVIDTVRLVHEGGGVPDGACFLYRADWASVVERVVERAKLEVLGECALGGESWKLVVATGRRREDSRVVSSI